MTHETCPTCKTPSSCRVHEECPVRAAGAETLPVVATSYTMEALGAFNPRVVTHVTVHESLPAGTKLIRQSDAMAVIARLERESREWHDRAIEAQAERDAAREERDEARTKLQDFALQALSDERQADEATAASIEALMVLADKMMRASWATGGGADYEAAREALRSALAGRGAE